MNTTYIFLGSSCTMGMFTRRTTQWDENWEWNTWNINTYLRHVAINPLGVGQDVIPQDQASSQGLKTSEKAKDIRKEIKLHKHQWYILMCWLHPQTIQPLASSFSLFLNLPVRNDKVAFKRCKFCLQGKEPQNKSCITKSVSLGGKLRWKFTMGLGAEP